MTENAFRLALQRRLVATFGSGVYVQKNHGSAFSAGLPDLELCIAGHVAWVELKAEPQDTAPRTVSALQLYTLRSIIASGGTGYVLCLHQRSDVVARWHVRLAGLELGPSMGRSVLLNSTPDVMREFLTKHAP